MKMLISISWRNIWRHPARSGVLIGAIIAGIWAGIVLSGWANGLIEQRFNRVIQDELTHLQLHHAEFLTEREPQMTLDQADSHFRWLADDERVRSFTGRTLSDGMIQSPLTTSGVQIRGVDPDSERGTTTFHQNIVEGEYLDSELRHPILLGRKLAEKLNVEVGYRVVLSFQDLENNLTSGAFTVAGIFSSGHTDYDERNVFVRNRDLSELIAGELVYHEIAVMLYDAELSDELVKELRQEFPGISAETWYELSPELRFMTDVGQSYLFYIMIVVLAALAFGILNTMLMAIFERMRELGMLMAIGMSKLRIFLMVMLEAVMLTLTGAVLGMGLAWITVDYLGERGIDLSAIGGDTMAEWGYDAVVYPSIPSGDFVSLTFLVVGVALISALYPSYKALKLNPADVVREK